MRNNRDTNFLFFLFIFHKIGNKIMCSLFIENDQNN
jgi:hypothetical protein